MSWYRWREKTSAGPGPWEYIFSAEELLVEMRAEKDSENYWNEHWRGIEWEVVDRPPDDWLASELNKLRVQVAGMKAIIEEYTKLLLEKK